MKKIINGKKYDTDTACVLGEWRNEKAVNDFAFCKETLHRKRTGEFFIYGEGGPASCYAEHEFDGWCWGSKIIPLTYDAACKWAETHLDADQYEQIFGEIDEDDGHVALTLSISSAAAAKARRAASQQGVSLSAYVESLL